MQRTNDLALNNLTVNQHIVNRGLISTPEIFCGSGHIVSLEVSDLFVRSGAIINNFAIVDNLNATTNGM